MERKFTEAETTVLSHFFTNTDLPIYCATDNMPTSLWAYLTGGYSRSQLSMRERFLYIFEEMLAEHQACRLHRDELVTIGELAAAIGSESGNRLLNAALERASKFMSKWAVEYGHNSLKDGSTDRFAVEGLSQRATKLLEATKLGAYQEKSTRYLDFSRDTLKLPETLRTSLFAREVEIVSRDTMTAYGIVLERLIQHYKTKIPRTDFKTEAAWVRTANAKAFDSARYLLPLSVRTSLGITIPTRETERLISSLLASPHDEVRAIGEQMHIEAVKVNPGLLRHVKANKYLERSCNIAMQMFAETATEDCEEPISEFGVRLMQASPDINLLALAVSLQASEGTLHDTATVLRGIARQSQDFADSIADSAMRNRGPHDEWPHELAIGQFVFDIVMDFGAYRDLQRHRVGMQLRVKPTTELGFVTPPVFAELDMETQVIYESAMRCMTELNRKVAVDFPNEAEYLTTLGHLCRFTYVCDLRQFAYLVELRSGPAGHASYRQIAHEMARAVMPLIPSFAKFLRVNWEGEVDRRIAEERTQARIAELKAVP